MAQALLDRALESLLFGDLGIDIVEAEGWRLESVVHRFIPARVQTSFLRGADFLSGDPVQGDEKYLYLFRRVEGAPGDSREA